MWLLLNKFKWYILVAGLIIWSAGLWHVASTYTDAKYVKQALEIKEHNDDLRDHIDKKLQTELAKIKPQITTINNEIQREIQTNTVYRDCKSTDGVMHNYDKLLEAQ